MSAHRRPLVTAAAAGSVLLALWFVPTAKAAPERPHTSEQTVPHSASAPSAAPAGADAVPASHLARTGGADTVPYLAGGLGFLGAGGVLVFRSLRRPVGR